MSVDFSKTPLDNLMEMLNAKSSVVAKATDFIEIDRLTVLTDDVDGRNTQLSLRTNMEFSHAGRVNPKFNRLPLNSVITPRVNVTVEDYATFEQVLETYRRKYGVYVDVLDVQPDQPFDVSGGDLSYAVAVTSPATSFGYKGTAVLNVNVNWRFDDPEKVEMDMNQLRQLVQFDLPLALNSLSF